MNISAKLAAIAIAIAVLPACTSVYAVPITEDDPSLRLRLKNELRRADKPSAGNAKNIYAWVQGALIDFRSGYYHNYVEVEGGAYYVYKLGARENMSTRWYLDDHDSFGLALGAVNFKPTHNALLKIGRFVTDYGYGSLPWRIPLIGSSSQRTLPTVSEGALGYLEVSPNLEFWAMWRSRVFNWTDSTTGVRDEGVFNTATGKYDKHRPRTFLASSWHNAAERYSVGASIQQDVSTQLQTILEKREELSEQHALKGELLGMYIHLDGLSRSDTRPNETSLISGQLTWITPWGNLFTNAGYLRHAINGAIVDTDLGYPFSLSLDRNKEAMISWQVGASYNLTPSTSILVAPIITHGYESNSQNVKIEGMGVLGGVNYRQLQGPLKGLNIFLAADKGREKRDGSELGDRLNYWDVKLNVQYDFTLR